jgi:hypothetical protein
MSKLTDELNDLIDEFYFGGYSPVTSSEIARAFDKIRYAIMEDERTEDDSQGTIPTSAYKQWKPPKEYPIGMLLEFSDDGDSWYSDRLAGIDPRSHTPYQMEDNREWYPHARLPIKWDLVGAEKTAAIVMDTGAVLFTCYPESYCIGQWTHDGTVIWIEERPR